MLREPNFMQRGSTMAADLAATPVTRIRVQACGDTHLGNFRGFATPERRIVFDIHDLDAALKKAALQKRIEVMIEREE